MATSKSSLLTKFSKFKPQQCHINFVHFHLRDERAREKKYTSKVDFVVFDKLGKKKSDFNACFFDVFLVTTNRQ